MCTVNCSNTRILGAANQIHVLLHNSLLTAHAHIATSLQLSMMFIATTAFHKATHCRHAHQTLLRLKGVASETSFEGSDSLQWYDFKVIPT